MLCPRCYGIEKVQRTFSSPHRFLLDEVIPHIAIVTCYLMSDYPDCAPSPPRDWWRKWGALCRKKRFSAEQKCINI
jgi:hypothetical protein